MSSSFGIKMLVKNWEGSEQQTKLITYQSLGEAASPDAPSGLTNELVADLGNGGQQESASCREPCKLRENMSERIFIPNLADNDVVSLMGHRKAEARECTEVCRIGPAPPLS
jgi:hypothetical protein